MKMVAAAKLRRAQESAEKGRPYSEKMNNIILNLSGGISDKENAPKLLSGSGNDKIHLCVIMTSDRGLCGGFNSNIIKKAKSYFAKLAEDGIRDRSPSRGLGDVYKRQLLSFAAATIFIAFVIFCVDFTLALSLIHI